MIVIASRSSTTARVSRNVRSAAGRCGADHGEHGQREGDVGGGRDRPAGEVPGGAGVDRDVDQRRAATMPPTAAATGSAARRGSRRSPATNSRLSSSPATKKKIASSPSAAHWRQREVQVQRGRADRGARDSGGVGRAPRASSPRRARAPPRRPAAGAADGLGAQDRRRSGGPRASCRGRTAGSRDAGRGGHGAPRRVDDRTADQTSRHTAQHLTGVKDVAPHTPLMLRVAGASALTRTPCRPHCVASSRVRATTAGQLVGISCAAANETWNRAHQMLTLDRSVEVDVGRDRVVRAADVALQIAEVDVAAVVEHRPARGARLYRGVREPHL